MKPTSPTDWNRIRAIFDACATLDGTAREEKLASLCGEDQELRLQVLEYLEASEQGQVHLEPPEQESDLTRLKPGSRVGDYVIEELIGRGGMGEVYRATQENPVKRLVALKVIRSASMGREITPRFAREQQALALMEHENIARLLDAGQLEDGLPFFAMEYCPGQPITTYCDRRELKLEERLRLLQVIALGVHHAHQKNIIHRDLKPSNLLVISREGRPVPKIIDFGIARGANKDHEAFTLTGQFIGTPAYMSPEQALGRSDIDQRTDIYSLGVVLYELLTGELPLEFDQTPAGLLAWQRKLVDTDPVRPSRRVAETTSEMQTVARRRAVNPLALRRRLRGDLDWIALRALAREPARRYASANELALDIERYLRREPVLAGPPGALYQSAQFVRRHKAPVAFALLAITSLLVAVVLTSLALLQSKKNEQRAQNKEQEATAATGRERLRRYRANLGACLYAVDAGNLAEAQRLLEECPKEHRSWEWDHLSTMVNQHDLSCLHTFQYENMSLRLVFRPGTNQIILGEGDTVRVIDCTTKTETASFPPPPFEGDRFYNTNLVTGLGVAPDGSRLAAGYYGGDVVVRDLETGRESYRLKNGKSAQGVGFSSDGTELFVGSALGERSHHHEIRFYDAETGEHLRSLIHNRPVGSFDAKMSPGGTLLAEGSMTNVHVWDLETAEVRATFQGGDHTHTVNFSPSGSFLVAASENARPAWIFNLVENTLLTMLSSPVGNLNACNFVTEDIVATGDDQGRVRLWGRADGDLLRTFLGHSDSIWGLAINDDQSLLASSSNDKTIRVWNLESATPVQRLEYMPGQVSKIIPRPDGKAFAAIATSGHFQVFDLDRNPIGQRLPIKTWQGGRHAIFPGTAVNECAWNPREVSHMVLSLDPSQYFDPKSNGAKLIFWNSRTEEHQSVELQERNIFLCYTNDGKELVCVSQAGLVHVRNSSDGTVLRTLRMGETARYGGVALDEPSQRLVAVRRDGRTGRSLRLHILDMGTGDVTTSPDLDCEVSQLLFSRDRSVLFTAQSNGIGLRDKRTGELTALWKGHAGAVNSIDAFRGEERLVTTGTDRTVRLWDLRDGTNVHTMRVGMGATTAVSIVGNDDCIIAGQGRGDMTLWWRHR